MTRKLLFLILAILTPVIAAAQEPVGAQPTEIGTALFGGGLLMMRSPAGDETTHNYMLSIAVARNVTHWIGIEGDIGVAFGRHTAHEIFGVVPSNSKTPNMLLYSGNIVYSPWRSDRHVVPYVSGGVGAISVFTGEQPGYFPLGTDTTHLTASAGGGIRWFPILHWGLRGDYRYLGIANDTPAPAGQAVVHSAHRVYGALIITF